MPRVVMTQSISGTRDGADWPRKGEQLDVDEREAEHLISAGLAAAVVVESAQAPDAPETAAAKPVRRTRKRA